MDRTSLPQSCVEEAIYAMESAAGDTKKTWIEQIEADLKTLRCSISEAKIITANSQERKRVVQAILNPAEPTSTLKGRTASSDAS
ncbi:hypothetical protein Y032_0123g1114 [Ancylostoma ceylanicum]|nr:hypothetical protein Y032_0123g1114 [Ancylostoma ceylanicum]